MSITVWPEVKPYPSKPLLAPTLVLLPAPGDIESPYNLAHRLLADALTAVEALQRTHDCADLVASLASRALSLFENAVTEMSPLDMADDARERDGKAAYYTTKFGDAA